MNIKKKNLNLILLYFLLLSASLNYLPSFKKMSIFLYTSFLLLVFINIKQMLVNLKQNKFIIICNLYILIYFGISKVFLGEIVIEDFYSLILFQIIFLLLFSISLKEIQKNRLVKYIGIFNIIASTILIIKLKGSYGNAINTIGHYFFGQKNAYSPILSFSIIYILNYALFKEKDFLAKVVYIILSLLGILNIVIIQSRTNLIMIFIVSLLMFIYKLANIKNIHLYIIPFTIFVSLVIINNMDSIEYFLNKSLKIDYFITVQSNYTYGILDALTSGRIESYIYSFKYFLNNILFGIGYNLNIIRMDPGSATGVHNLWLRALFYGGIIYFIVFVFLIYSFLKLATNRIKDKKLIKFAIIAMSINSLFEPFAPLGPGTSYILLWVMLCLGEG